jgi:hypothetical protein
MLFILQASPLSFTADILGLAVGSFSFDMSRQRVSLF